jgi:stage V sporulation protein SpoVS
MAHEHVYADDGDTERPWTTVVVDAVAALLRGEYEVHDHYRGARLVKTRVHDTLLGRRHISTSGSLLGLLPFFSKVDRVGRRAVDFRCRG